MIIAARYFMPFLGNLHPRERVLLVKNGRFLKDNLLFGRSIMKLGTLLFCLDYAKGRGWAAAGVWKDIEQAYSRPEMDELHSLLTEVNSVRNRHVAHVEEPLRNDKTAWQAIIKWLRCLDLMVSLAA